MGQSARFDELSEVIDESQTIAICAHTSPDGDAIGSTLGLAEVIGLRAGHSNKMKTGL